MRDADDASGDGEHGSTRGSASSGDVLTELRGLESSLGGLVPELVPERVPGWQVNKVVQVLSRIEKRAAGCRLVLAKAAADTGSWRAAGARSPAEHAAKQNGTSVGEAKADLAASKKLEDQPLAREAATSGDISADQTKAVAQGAAADPSKEGDLVATAKGGDLADVRDAARKVIQGADERSGKKRAERMFRQRALRTWLELDGEGRGSWNVPPAYQARFLAALEPYRRIAFQQARAAGRREPAEALMADAMDLLARDVLLDWEIDPDTPPDPNAMPTHPGNRFRGTGSDDQPGDGPNGDGPRGPDGPDGDPNDSPGGPDGGRPSGPSDAGGAPSLFDPPEDATPDTDPSEAAPTDGPDPGESTGTEPASGNPARGSSTQPAGRGGQRRPKSTSQPRRRRGPAQVNIHIDFDALMRGHTHDGELCEIPGLGPIPVSLAREMADHALLRLILTGTDVTVIATHTRYVPVAVRAAAMARENATCSIPGCHVTHHLQLDHWQHDYAAGGETSAENLTPLCPYHHHLKTYSHWRLVGGPGKWQLLPPDAPEPDAEPP